MNQRTEAVEKWANFVKDNPDWKHIHTEFINSQFMKTEEFIKRLLKQKNGVKKVIDLYKIKNVKGYDGLLNSKKHKK